ncbi:hypothetical protein H109_01778 [Trichophyton interdigitale MR816]|uniref:Transcription factor Iwr1 domain-containing protein n=1 Tax=Trichophyton interdigitale (strain MR816) TaxID=1215338 RepID=A0A059JFZ3_TRIIM|nr:hypothetical protein H101_05559 [Trichophyton interdigitale H6]KDB26412.1 hypothetical protein H109_01778 [Trichophyton interdigitale MR816]
MPSDTQLPPKGPSKPNQLPTPRGEKRNADGTIKEQLSQVSHLGMAARDTTLLSDTLALAPEGQDRDMSEFSGGYDTEGEFGADEMEEDEEEDEEDESERDDEDKQQDTEGKKKGKRPDRDFGPGNGNGNGNGYGNGGDAGDDGYEGDSDDSGASTDCNFDDDESDGAPVFEPNNDGEVPSLDSVDPRTFGEIVFDTIESHMQTRVWVPDEESIAMIENETEGNSLFQNNAFQLPGEGSSSSESVHYYDLDDLYYAESVEETSDESNEDSEDNGSDNESEAQIEEARNEDGDEAATSSVSTGDTHADDNGNDDMGYDDDTPYPHPIATEDMNTWYTDPILANVIGHEAFNRLFLGRDITGSQQNTAGRTRIWEDEPEPEDTPEDLPGQPTSPIIIDDLDTPSTSPGPEEENKENKYPESDTPGMESEVENGILEEGAPGPSSSSNPQPWVNRYSPVETRERQPMFFGADLRPVPSLAGRVPVLNVNPNGPRTQVHEWFGGVGANIQDVPE